MSARILGLLCALGACGDNVSVGGGDAGPVEEPEQGSLATGPLAINEVSPRPGDGPDWIEIVNRSDAPVDLCDYFLSDSLDRLDHYLPLGGAAPPEPCEPDRLEPGAYRVIAADDNADGDGAPFRLGPADEVHIINTDGAPIDSLVYLYQAPGRLTLARRPDRDGRFVTAEPTPGEANR